MENSTTNQQNTPVDKAKRAAYQKQYRLNNKAKLRTYDKQYRLDNKAKITGQRKHYILKNKSKIAAYGKQNYLKNKSKIAAYGKQYMLDNKAKIAVRRKQYHKQRLKTDLFYRIKYKLRRNVYEAFKRIGQNKPAKTEQLLGCTWLEAKAHFERLFQEGMSWENHGEWHIDHIRPVASFKEDELHLMNHINNLQPLWAEENIGSKKILDNIKWCC